jgi:hypothetical protein
VHDGVIIVIPVLLGFVSEHFGTLVREILILGAAFWSMAALMSHGCPLSVPHNLLAVETKRIDFPVDVDADEMHSSRAHLFAPDQHVLSVLLFLDVLHVSH